VLSFRFHIVSLIAVFLALAIGIAVGSTFIDRAIVDSLQDRVDSVSANLDSRRAENAVLGERVDNLESYVDDVGAYAVEDRLNGRSIVVVAERGVEEEPVEAQVELLRSAGADVPGVLWLEPEMALADDADRLALAEAFEIELDEAGEMRARVWRLLAGGDQAESTEALTILIDGGFAALDTVGGEDVDPGDLRLPSGTVLLVTGNESQVGPTGLHVAEAAAVLVEADVPVMAGEVFRPPTDDEADPAPRGSTLQLVLDDPVLRQSVATDDALDLGRGRIAAVLVLDDLARGDVDHVGYGEGADGPLPPPSGT